MKALTQKKMAELLGISDGHLCDILRGRRRMSVNVARKIKAKTNISFDFSFEHTPEEVFSAVRTSLNQGS